MLFFSGFQGAFPGLLPLVQRYVDSVPGTDDATRAYIGKVLKFISMKASGMMFLTSELGSCHHVPQVAKAMH